MKGDSLGWALDTAAPSTSIDVHIYFDRGTAQVRAYATPTNNYRPDVNAAYGVSGNHGFDFAIPPELLDGVQHKVEVFAIDPHDAGNPLLSGCPRSFTKGTSQPQAAGTIIGAMYHNWYTPDRWTQRGPYMPVLGEYDSADLAVIYTPGLNAVWSTGTAGH